MSVHLVLSTTAEFEQRTPPVVLSQEELAELLDVAGYIVRVEASNSSSGTRLFVLTDDGNYETDIDVHQLASIGWKGGASLELEKLIVGWYIDQVAGREDVWLYSASGDLLLRLSPDTYVQDLERIHSGWWEQRDMPPGLDLG